MILEFLAKIIARSRLWQIDLERCSGIFRRKIQVLNRYFTIDPLGNCGHYGQMQIQVDCYAGYRGEETPRYIRMATYKIEVREIVDRWLSPDHRYFKIMGSDDATYIIRHDTRRRQWELVFYQVGGKIAPLHSDSGKS